MEVICPKLLCRFLVISISLAGPFTVLELRTSAALAAEAKSEKSSKPVSQKAAKKNRKPDDNRNCPRPGERWDSSCGCCVAKQ